MTSLDYQNRLTKAQGKQELFTKYLLADSAKLSQEREQLVAYEEAQAFIQLVAQHTQEQLKFHIEDMVQMALDTCFPGKYQFRVEFEIKRGQTEASLVFFCDGQPIDPMDSSGGGAVDLASFALRIAAWSLSKTRGTIILDEPFRFLDKSRQPLAGDIMQELSKTLGLQFIMVTHSDYLVNIADRVFQVSQEKGVSKVESSQGGKGGGMKK